MGPREVVGPRSFSALFRALDGWLPEGAVLYFEGGHPDAEIEAFMAAHAVPEQFPIALGTIWPKPRVFHVPATKATLGQLATIMERHSWPEVAVHFHVYCRGAILLQWHDVFGQEMVVADSVSEESLRELERRFRSAAPSP